MNHAKNRQTAKDLMLWSAAFILATEVGLIIAHYPVAQNFVIHYGWVAPLLFFKSFIKKFLLLNVFGLLQVLWGLCGHVFKLLLIKLLKTFGVRYGVHFSCQRWKKHSQKIRIISKIVQRRVRQFQGFMASFSRAAFFLILLAFLPLFLLLFLFGVAFRLTREAMVKKGGEIGVSKVAFCTARKSHGLIARLRQLDAWILQRIELLTQRKD